jgi:uncharacterized protein (TIGR02453 family)
MKNTVDLAPTLSFLKALEKNNDRVWFEKHRQDYEAASARFEDFVSALIIEMSAFEELSGVSPKDCMFRIYRDMRFSKDKTPYKVYMSAAIEQGGRKSKRPPYYLQVGPGDHSMLAGGCHEAAPGQLARWRHLVDTDPAPVKKILSVKSFKEAFGGLSGEKLAKAPKGYPADHPEVELLKLKEITAMHPLTDAEVLMPDVVQKSVVVFKAMKPLLDYLSMMLPRD